MSKLKDATAKLRARYLEGLPAKWRVVEEAVEQLRGGNHDAVETLRRVAHQVRGTAASFGFVVIDKSATRVEHAEDADEVARQAEGFARALRAAYEAESTPTTRVLLIDDDPGIGFVMKALLGEAQLSVTQVTTAAAAVAELEREPWGLVFVDLVLPDADGRTLLSRLRALPLHRETPVVVLSAKTGSLVKNECAVYGIDDFIEKPIDPSTFAVHVSAVLERARAQPAVAQEDELTGLPNRLGFRRDFAKLSPRMRRTLTLALIDVDHFQAYNEAKGRAAGDRALHRIAQLLRASVREADLLGRWGGEEFIVAFPALAAVEAVELLGRASEALRAEALGAELGEALTFSAGITELGPDEDLDYGLLRADQLLVQAKRLGRGRWYAHTFEASDDGRPKLLVAEDDPMAASLLLRDLSEDYEITYVPDGDAAVDAAEAGDFDLVLLDYQMPKRDGVEVVRVLREHEAYKDKPILLLTAIGSDAAVEAAFDAGADDYISKPHRKRALLARLARHLGRAPSKPSNKPALRREAVDTEVTALFCDISGFSNLAANLPPREVLELLNTYFPVISEVVLRHGGTLEKYIGDAVLAIWGVPKASEDDAKRAVAAAVDIQRATRELAKTSTPPLRLHIGLNSGPVAAATVGSDEHAQYAAVGDTTNLASRVCDLAGPGQILLSSATLEALGGRGDWPVGLPERAEVDGRDEPVTVHTLRWDEDGA